MNTKFLKNTLLVILTILISGCNFVVMDPSGDIAIQQRDLLVYATALILIIIIPVIVLIFFFAWKYRESNKEAEYDPEWHHSTRLELIIWTAPVIIIMILGAITWISTYRLDPYRPIDRISAQQALDEKVETLVVEVVSLDWKWLFFYPEYGIATVNEMAAPTDRPIKFKITSNSSMNSLYIPALAGQIYAMKGMETQLHAVINETGVYDGFSANYSGAGFSHMNFKFHGLSSTDFDQWVNKVKASALALDREEFKSLEQPSSEHAIVHYATTDVQLYDDILNMCADSSDMCMRDQMCVDKHYGGGGLAAVDYEVAKKTFVGHCRAGKPRSEIKFHSSSHDENTSSH